MRFRPRAMTPPSRSVTTAPTGIVPAANASHASWNASRHAGSRSSQLCMACSPELSRWCEAIEDAADLAEDAREEVLERAGVLEPADGDRVVARVADQLLGHLACLVVGRVQATWANALVADLVVQRGK